MYCGGYRLHWRGFKTSILSITTLNALITTGMIVTFFNFQSLASSKFNRLLSLLFLLSLYEKNTRWFNSTLFLLFYIPLIWLFFFVCFFVLQSVCIERSYKALYVSTQGLSPRVYRCTTFSRVFVEYDGESMIRYDLYGKKTFLQLRKELSSISSLNAEHGFSCGRWVTVVSDGGFFQVIVSHLIPLDYHIFARFQILCIEKKNLSLSCY